MAFTLAEAREFRAAAKAAVLAAMTAESYGIAGRSLQRAKIAEAEASFAKWDRIVSAMECGRGTGIQAFRIMPRDL